MKEWVTAQTTTERLRHERDSWRRRSEMHEKYSLGMDEINEMLEAERDRLLSVVKEVALPPYPDSDPASLLSALRAMAQAAIDEVEP